MTGPGARQEGGQKALLVQLLNKLNLIEDPETPFNHPRVSPRAPGVLLVALPFSREDPG